MTTCAVAHRPVVAFPNAPMSGNVLKVTHTSGPARGHSYRRTFTNATSAAPSQARTWADQRLTPLGINPETAALVISELVTNAVLHGGPRITLTARTSRSGIRIQVTDAGQRTTPADDRDDGEHGYGLILVEELCDQFDMTRTADSTTVTARLPIGGEQ